MTLPRAKSWPRKFAERAAELSGDDPLVLAVLGAVHTFVRNHGTARVLLERALTLDTNAAWAWSRLGWIENYSDRPERAIEKFERALRLSPLDPMNFNNYVGMASANEVTQDYDKAAALYRRERLRNGPTPDGSIAIWHLRCRVQAGWKRPKKHMR